MLIKLILITLSGVLPPLLSLLIIRQAKQRWQSTMVRIRNIDWYYHTYQTRNIEQSLNQSSQSNNIGHIGESSCVYNARSPYLRCTVNPSGPCTGCTHYRKNI